MSALSVRERGRLAADIEAAGRQDLADKEKSEVVVIEVYMPQRLSETEVDDLVRATIAETGASGPKDMGKVMAAMKAKAAGRADMTVVSARVKALLS